MILAAQQLPGITEKLSETSLNDVDDAESEMMPPRTHGDPDSDSSDDPNTSSSATSSTSSSPSPPPPEFTAKLMEARDSITSIDSDVSLSFDRDNGVGSGSDEGRTGAAIEDANLADMSDSASDNGGKDSGCEVAAADAPDSEAPFTPPTDEFADRIVQQVEFYFSDANITKDAFLLKHVKRNKEGYVSLKLISSFKRVKHITKDWRVVAHALQRSTKLEINEAGTKLRRRDALPQYDETTPSRTVVSVNMPIEKPTIENVAELFRACGEIALIRILRPGNPIPADVRQFINKNPSLAGTVCALVEFVASESARKALQLVQQHPELRVHELNCVPHPERKKKVSVKGKTNSGYGVQYTSDYSSAGTSCPSSSEAEDKVPSSRNGVLMDPRLRMRRGSSAHFPARSGLAACTEPAAWLQRRLSASSTEASFMMFAPPLSPRRLSYGSSGSSIASSRGDSTGDLYGGGGGMRRISACATLPPTSEHYYGPATNCHGYHHHIPAAIAAMPCHHHAAHYAAAFAPQVQPSPNGTTYYQRRQSACSVSSEGSSGRSRSNSAAFLPASVGQENVVRLPRGPDGSRGFRQRCVV